MRNVLSDQRLGVQDIAGFIALTLLCFLAAEWGLLWQEWARLLSPLNLAAGIALAGLLIGGIRLWPAILLGYLLAYWLGSSLAPPVWVQLTAAVGVTLSAVVGAYGLLHFRRIDLGLSTLRDVLWLCVWGAMLSPVILATADALCRAIVLDHTWNQAALDWVNAWLGAVTGLLVVVPLVLAWMRGGPLPRNLRYWLQLALCILLAAVLTWGVFKPEGFRVLRSWLIFPVLMWAALLFQVRGAATAVLAITFFSVWGTYAGGGMPAMSAIDPSLHYVLLQQFIAVAAISTLVLAVVADERKAKDALRESEERYRVLTEVAPQAVWMADYDGSMIYCNEWWVGLTGLTVDQSRLGQWMAVVHPDHRERVRDAMRQAVMQRESYEIEIPFCRASDGTYRWHLARGKPLRNKTGEVTRWIGTAFDIQDRKEAEQHREQVIGAERAARAEAERVGRMKDEFLATLSHELRTPLNAILGWTQLLQSDPSDAEDVRQGLETIDRNARVQAQLIEDLLDMSRIISGKVRLDVERLDFVTVIEEALNTVRLAAQAKGIDLVKNIEVQPAWTVGDSGRLQQVVWNLLSNAIKFTPRGGRVELRLQQVDDYNELLIIDTGRGIRREFLPYVFDQFRQADATTTRMHGGLGLGLTIVRSLVELHGGSVSVDSDGENCGAQFNVRLPAAMVRRAREIEELSDAVAPRLRQSRSLRDMPRLTGLKVLVVDDELDARNLVRRIFLECDAEVLLAASSPEALDVAAAEKPDVMVSDIGMPGMDGYELIRRLRARGDRLPAIALTAFARSDDRARALEAGYQAHIAKPVDTSELIMTVASLGGRLPPTS